MAKHKRYYWLRLKRDFFKRHDIKIIEAMENGTDYILFYLKLLCESVDHEGNLRFSDEIPYDDKMLSVITDTNIDIVRSAIKVFSGLGMMELMDDGTYFMSGIEKLMGSETDEHVREQNRIRQQRCRDKKRLGMNNNICVYCGSDGDTIDHIIPKVVGGSDDASNIVYACLKCNMKKNDLPLDRFLNNKILDGESVDVDGILINPKLNKYVTFDYLKNRFEPLEALHNEMSRVTRNGEKEIEKDIYIKELSKDNSSSHKNVERVLSEWNNLPEPIKKVRGIKPNTERYRMLTSRIKEYGIDSVIEAVHKVGESDFLRRGSDKGWQIDFGWFVRPNNFPKVLEGNYDNKNTSTASYYSKPREEWDSYMWSAAIKDGYVTQEDYKEWRRSGTL